MSKLVNFLLLIKKIIDYNKKDIDNGDTPPDIYNICSCIRTAFCLSYNIRKENNLFLYFQENKVLVKFQGNLLRYLGPDERSQALLLKKALNKMNQHDNSTSSNWIKSTPGILVKTFNDKHSFILWLKLLNLKHIAYISNSISIHELSFLAHMYDFPHIKKISDLNELDKIFFVFSLNSYDNSILMRFLSSVVQIFPSMLEYITLIPLKNISKTEDKILYVNFLIDHQECKK